MTLDELLERLAAFEPTGFPFITLYLDARSTDGRVGYDSFVRKELAERAKTYAPNSSERESFERDAARITTYLAEEREPSANGLAIFACAAADEFFEAAQLGAPVETNRIFVYDQPHLYPLARLMDQYPRYAVLVATTNQARIFVFGRGKTLDHEEVEGKKVNRVKVGGWSQQRYQRRMENQHAHHVREVVETLDRVVREDGARHIILAGDEVVMPILRGELPHHLNEMVIDRMNLDIDTPEHEILDMSQALLREHDAETDAEKVTRLFDEYRSGNLGTVGVPNTLVAFAGGQIEELLITAHARDIDYSERKVERVLAAFDPEGARTEIDASETRVVADELIRRAQDTGARVTFIEDAALLAEVGGVGALLRYPLVVEYSDSASRLVASAPITIADEPADTTSDRVADVITESRTAPDDSDVTMRAGEKSIIETRVFHDLASPIEQVETRTPQQGAASIKLTMRDGEVRRLVGGDLPDVLEAPGHTLAQITDYDVLRKARPPEPEPEASRIEVPVAAAVVANEAVHASTNKSAAHNPVREAEPEVGGFIESLQHVGEKIEEEVQGFVDKVKSIFSG